MKIETKHNLNDLLFFMKDNEVKSMKVTEVITHSYDEKVLIYYTFDGVPGKIKECNVASTKEELLANL